MIASSRYIGFGSMIFSYAWVGREMIILTGNVVTMDFLQSTVAAHQAHVGGVIGLADVSSLPVEQELTLVTL